MSVFDIIVIGKVIETYFPDNSTRGSGSVCVDTCTYPRDYYRFQDDLKLTDLVFSHVLPRLIAVHEIGGSVTVMIPAATETELLRWGLTLS